MGKRKSRISPQIVLGIIVALAFFLRFHKVTQIPPSLNWDETSIAYNAYSILKTGKDEWGKAFPIHFKSYGEYKLPMQIYFSIPGIAVFGLNEVGVRITPVVYGTLTVLLVYFLAYEVFRKKSIGLIASFLMAISVWHIQLTRASFESSFALFWLVLGVWLMLRGFRAPKWWILSAIAFAASVYTYNSARVFTPLFLTACLVIFRKRILKYRKTIALSGLLFIVLLIPLVPFVVSGEGSARYKLVSITNDPGLIPRINERRGSSNLPDPLPRLIHNRVTYVSYYFARNYISHFSPNFLFISGAPHKQHHVQNMGQLYLFQAPFLILGLYLLFRKKQKYRWLIITWMLIAYIPVSTTQDSIPHALRTLISSPTYQLITAFGIFYFYTISKKKFKPRINVLLWLFIIGIALVNFSSYLYEYYHLYPKQYSRDWQYGYRQVLGYVKENKQKYDLIVFSRHYGEPHMFTLFFLGYDPFQYQNNPSLERFESHDWVWVTRFDKFYFPDLGDQGTMFDDLSERYKDKKILFIGKLGDFPEHLPKLLTVDFLNGKRAFEVVEVK
jgi:4-amino-4-deoxy-L-arabinose transferase-like glycosyltransferase